MWSLNLVPLSTHSLPINSSKNWYASSTNIVLFKVRKITSKDFICFLTKASLMTLTQSVKKIMKALNDYKPIEEWSIHAKNYSNTKKQKCPYLAGILQVEEQRQRKMQNSNDMINTS